MLRRIIGSFFIAFLVVGGGRFGTTILKDLPSIEEIEDFSFKQATTITDRNGEVLYRMFEENRQYVPYEEVSENFVDAIIATEDQRFRENPGVDPKGMVRAVRTDLRYGKTQWGSTLTQQLIKLILLTPEKKLERKLKEIILAMKLSKHIEKNIKQNYQGLSDKEIDRKVKEKVMELYANLIFFGNNAYGIEAAAQTYFSTKASDLSILQAAILAGMPQAPSRYDPFLNNGLLMGQILVHDDENNPVELTTGLQQQIISKVETNINNSKLGLKKDDQAMIEFLTNVLDFKISDEGQTYYVSYQAGRKDVVLARIFEENYITEHELKKAFMEWLNFTFKRGSGSLKAPHFVFRVINQLQQEYSQEVLQKGGLTIRTSLDYTIQKMAEDSIKENEYKITGNLANNTAMVYVDSKNGDVLAYVGSRDYNNDEIDGQVDIIQSLRQPGSTIKPLIYALGFMKLPLTLDSPIYDLRTKLGNDQPDNADGTFRWLTTIRQALAGSRNIPAIKMFLSVGGESAVKPFLAQVGITGLKQDGDFYGYPLAIGSAEIKMIDLVNAYAHLSAMGKPATINPILEIRGSDNSLLYKKQVELQEQIIPTGVTYLLRKILSDNTNMPANRVGTFTAPGKIRFATKTGTTNVVKGKEKLPRDGWLMSYTPSKVLAFRVGNTDGSAMHRDAYGGRLSSPARKSFIKKLVDNGYLENETIAETDVKPVTISKISWKLITPETPAAFATKTLAYLKTAPTTTDATVQTVQVDTLCTGLVGPLTPPQEIRIAYYIQPESIMPDKRDQEDILKWRKESGVEKYKEELGMILLEALTGECSERTSLVDIGSVELTIIKPAAGEQVTRKFSLRHQSKSDNRIQYIKVYFGETEIRSLAYRKEGGLTDVSTITIPDSFPAGSYNLKVVAIDDEGFSDMKIVPLELIDQDTIPPFLMQEKVQVTPKEDDGRSVVLLFADDASVIDQGTIEQNGKLVKEFEGNVALFDVDTLTETVTYAVIDGAGNKLTGMIDLQDYE